MAVRVRGRAPRRTACKPTNVNFSGWRSLNPLHNFAAFSADAKGPATEEPGGYRRYKPHATDQDRIVCHSALR